MVMDFSSYALLLLFLLSISMFCSINSLETSRLPHTVKTIQSPHGDLMDCVLSHKQPAFDHPLLKGQKPLDPPERPRGHNQKNILSDNFQLWNLFNESCPKGTIPITRTKKKDMLRAGSINMFGRKLNQVRVDTTEHVHSFARVIGDRYYGAQANINVWAPHLENQKEFSLAQIWVCSGPYNELNTIEAGWQVSPENYGDSLPRLFVYWTADGYKQTGCYNLKCPGFVQTNHQVPIGGAISPSTFNGAQNEIMLLIYKDPQSGNWWLEYGSTVIGYWPSSLFTHLKDSASYVDFGGEVDTTPNGPHTSTQMGSGHFANERFRKAAYFRNLQVVNSDYKLIPLSNPVLHAEQPNCYNIEGGIDNVWGNYFYYGGPGRNDKCT